MCIRDRMQGDLLVLAARSFEDRRHLRLYEVVVNKGDKAANLPIANVPNPKNKLIILIKRGLKSIIPKGGTIILPNDTLVFIESESDDIKEN